MIESMILESIDNINNEVENSSFHVLESMVALYSKEIDFMDFCSTELRTEVFMEGSILDNVKKAGKKDSNKLITILAFIPRLIGEMCKAIAKAFNDSNLGKKLKDAGDKLNKLGSASEKKAKVDEINEKEGKEVVEYDEKTGKIKFKRTWSDAFAAVVWFASTFDILFNLFRNIKAEFDVTNPSAIRTFIDECDKILHKKKDHTASEVIDMGVDALGDVIKHISGSAGALAAAGTAASTIVGKKLTELKLNGENEADHTILVNIKELSNKLALINAGIFAATNLMGVAKKLLGYTGLGVGWFEKGRESNREARAEIYKDIITKDPDIVNRVPRTEGMSESDYQNAVVQQYYEDKYPDPNDDDKLNAEMDEAYKAAEDKLNASKKAEHDAAVKKYHDDKKAMRAEKPIFRRKKQNKKEE